MNIQDLPNEIHKEEYISDVDYGLDLHGFCDLSGISFCSICLCFMCLIIVCF